MKDEPVKCKHCGELPGLVKHCEPTGEVYWGLECDCKTTSYYRSTLWAVEEWETDTYKKEPAKALAEAKINF